MPKYTEYMEQERQLQDQLSELERRQEEIFAKQGRMKQFKNKSERDAHLMKEIKQLETHIDAENKSIDKLKKSITDIEKSLEEKNK